VGLTEHATTPATIQARKTTGAIYGMRSSPEHFSVSGGIYTNGEIHMASNVGVNVAGVIGGNAISGAVAEAGMSVAPGDSVWNQLSATDQSNLRGIQHGNDIEYVHGVMSGTWSPR
jgi:hypothetical protein